MPLHWIEVASEGQAELLRRVTDDMALVAAARGLSATDMLGVLRVLEGLLMAELRVNIGEPTSWVRARALWLDGEAVDADVLLQGRDGADARESVSDGARSPED